VERALTLPISASKFCGTTGPRGCPSNWAWINVFPAGGSETVVVVGVVFVVVVVVVGFGVVVVVVVGFGVVVVVVGFGVVVVVVGFVVVVVVVGFGVVVVVVGFVVVVVVLVGFGFAVLVVGGLDFAAVVVDGFDVAALEVALTVELVFAFVVVGVDFGRTDVVPGAVAEVVVRADARFWLCAHGEYRSMAGFAALRMSDRFRSGV
jgi:hypothetical protein